MRPEVTTLKSRHSRRAFVTLGLAALAVGFSSKSNRAGPANAAVTAEIGYMTPDSAHKAALAGEIILIDIRSPAEWLQTRVAEGAVGLDMRDKAFVPTLVALRRDNPDLPIALICRTGNRTGYVTETLANQGFDGLVDVNEGMAGGQNGPGWLKRGLPTYAGTPELIALHRSILLP
ncbi:MAG: rhodanese-related sulfurtransferase [Paracoccaceae bacterium]|jgi:rhodanese-related sulfurtransferase